MFKKNKYLAFIFFWGTILFLNLSKVFFDLFLIKEWNKTIWWIDHSYTEKAKFFTLIILMISLYSIIIGKIFGDFKQKNNIEYKEKFYKITKRIIYIVFFFSCIIFFIKSYKEIEIIKKFGYASLYTGILSNLKYPFYFKGNILLLRSSFYIIIVHKIKEKNFIIISFIYLSLFLLSALKGQRLYFLLEFLLLLFFYFRMYNKKINKKFYINFTIIVIIILFLIF